MWSIGGVLFNHSLEVDKAWEYRIFRLDAMASQIINKSIRIASIDITDPIDEIAFHVV